MKYLIAILISFIGLRASADYQSASAAVDAEQRAAEQQTFNRTIPKLNGWMTAQLTQYAKSLGGLATPFTFTTDEDGLVQTAEFSTKRGYECGMMVGIVLLNGRFNMIVSCASPQEAKKTGKVFRHGTQGWF